MRLLRKLNDRGKTIIMVTHENDIAAWARRAGACATAASNRTCATTWRRRLPYAAVP